MSTYTDHGYADRNTYLEELAEQAETNSYLVYAAAELLGPEEDFDGLLTTLSDCGVEVGP